MSIDTNHLYGVVVWYHPNVDAVTSALTYIHHLRQLFVVDNSENDNSDLLSALPAERCVYLPNFINQGIAAALNRGCRIAAQAGATWILTMDQDSRFDESSVPDYLAEAAGCDHFECVGVFSPCHICDTNKHHTHARYERRTAVMTSGNLLRTKAFETLGGFREDFFIDLVDDEFCCRLLEHGFDIVCLNQIHLTHQLGDGPKRICGIFRKTFIPHNALRHYYITRNTLWTIKLHLERKAFYQKQLWKNIKRTLLYDNRDKMKKIKYMYWGWRDYKHGISGAFQQS